MRTLSIRHGILAFLLGSLGSLSSAADDLPDLTLDDVILGVTARTQTLSALTMKMSCSGYWLKEASDGTLSTTPIPPFLKKSYDFQVKGQKIRMDRTSWDSGGDAPRVIGHYAWDGERCRAYGEDPSVRETVGGGLIRPEPSPSFYVGYQMVILEKHVFEIKAPLGSIVNEKTWTLRSPEKIGDAMSVLVEGPVPGYPDGQLKVWLDPARGFAPLRMRMRLPLPNGDDITEDLTDIELMQCDGVWLIKHARLLVRNPDVPDRELPGDVYVYEFTVRSAKVAPDLPDDVFTLAFPPGSNVLDAVSNVAFRVKEDGTMEPISVVYDVDAALGESLEPRELPDLDAVPNVPAPGTQESTQTASVRKTDGRSVNVADAPVPSRHYWLWVILGIACATGVAIVVLRARRRVSK